MRRKCAKSLTGVSDASVESAPESPVPRITWEELLARAEADLDERGREGYAKCRASAERHAKLNEGCGVRIDVDGVRGVLVDYYEQCVGHSSQIGLRRLFAARKVRFDDYSSGRKCHAEFGLVMEYAKKVRDALAREEAAELMSEAQAAQKRLVTEDGCDLNQRAVELTLKATMKDVYGDGDADRGDSKRKPIVYKFENLQVAMIMSPAELAAKKLDGATPVSEVVDVQ